MTLGILLTWLASYYPVKIAVLVIGFRFMWMTRNTRTPGFRLLWYAVGLFLTGEVFCGVNIYITQRLVLPFEILHGAGMVAGFSLFFYALWRILDTRVVHFTDESNPCVLLGFCGSCDRNRGNCRYERLFGWLLVVLAIMALVPFFSPVEEIRYAVNEFNLRDLLRMAWIPDMVIFPGGTEFVQPAILDVLDKRIYPAVAFIAFCLSYLSLRLAGPERDHLTVAAAGTGLGTLSYAAMKVTLYGIIDELAFASLWEEMTELVFILLIVMTWRLFRKPLPGV